MRLYTKISIDEIAEEISRLSDEEQANFLKMFIKALRINCASPAKAEIQLACIQDKLDNETKESLSILSDWD